MSNDRATYTDYLVDVTMYPEYNAQRASQGLPRRMYILVVYSQEANQELDNTELLFDDRRRAWRTFLAMVRDARLTRLCATDYME